MNNLSLRAQVPIIRVGDSLSFCYCSMSSILLTIMRGSPDAYRSISVLQRLGAGKGLREATEVIGQGPSKRRVSTTKENIPPPTPHTTQHPRGMERERPGKIKEKGGGGKRKRGRVQHKSQ